MRRARRSISAALAAALALAFAAATVSGVVGCRRSAEVTPETGKPGPPEVSTESANLLFTWIDDKGEFHVEQKPVDVPESAREAVRVVDPERGAPPDVAYLVDLRAAGPDGLYPVRAATRDEFEKVAVERRARAGKVLAAGPPSPVAPGGGAAAGANELVDRPDVIIYGASWCGPCHQAEAYMKQHHISYVEKDIEQDSGAAREMQAKLAKAGMRGGSIPVIDVKGKLLLGFDANAVQRALKM